jgi:hypothetical protein
MLYIDHGKDGSHMEARIKTGIWVSAFIRRVGLDGTPVMVARRGDVDAGLVLIKVNRLEEPGCVVYSPSRDLDGNRIWRMATGPDPVPEPDADTYIERQAKFDPDLWVLEIEDRAGRHFLDEPVES